LLNARNSELEREAKIARNRALIEQLELKNAVASVAPGPATKAKVSAKPKAKPIQPIKREKRIVDDAPRRVSARLRSAMIDPDETPTQKRKREVRSFLLLSQDAVGLRQ
jgi:hypothetical protein